MPSHPPRSSQVLSAFNLDINVIKLECSLPGISYSVKWAATMALPIAVGIILLLIHGAVVAYTVLVSRQKLKKAATAASPLVAMAQVLMYCECGRRRM
jgi:hypothetical protein